MAQNRNNRPNTKFERLPFSGKYSMKNIPIPSETEYKKKLILQMEKIVKNMCWKALFFLKDDKKYKSLAEDVEFLEREETYEFKSSKIPLPLKLMELFEK